MPFWSLKDVISSCKMGLMTGLFVSNHFSIDYHRNDEVYHKELSQSCVAYRWCVVLVIISSKIDKENPYV